MAITGVYVLDYPSIGLWGEVYDQDYNQVLLAPNEEVVEIGDELAIMIPTMMMDDGENAIEVARWPLLGSYLFNNRTQMNAWLAARRAGQPSDESKRIGP